NNRAGAANRIRDAPLAFEIVDEAVYARGIERAAADKQRLNGEGLAQLRAFEIFRDEVPNAAMAAERGEARDLPDHRQWIMEWAIREFREACVEQLLGMLEHTQITVAIARLDAPHLAERFFKRAPIIEGGAVLIEVKAIPRGKRLQRKVILAALAEECEQL